MDSVASIVSEVDSEVDCSICYLPHDKSKLVPQVCCVRDVCILCLRRWYNGLDVYGEECMVCKNDTNVYSIIGNLGKGNAKRETCKFYIDTSSFRNFLSSVNILRTTGACTNCGARITLAQGCPHIRCAWCLKSQYFELNSFSNEIFVVHSDKWYMGIVNTFLRAATETCIRYEQKLTKYVNDITTLVPMGLVSIIGIVMNFLFLMPMMAIGTFIFWVFVVPFLIMRVFLTMVLFVPGLLLAFCRALIDRN